MSSNPAIRISGLSKSYQIAHNTAQRPTNLGEAITQRLCNPFKRTEKETFWALKDIDLDIQRGEVVGVIGRNGAGKSTLLKILSRITEPTSGRIELFGRVGSLLEVGTGFHPELTGRENIFLNGAILGMKRAEIRRQFDEIIDFAGVEKFLDTPVKRYSSGMYVRLAFAVAAHLNPEILIIDEVLAVGDAEFQKKCLGKMQDVAQSGRTVIFVSHNMQTIESLTKRTLLLENGGLRYSGETHEAIAQYLSQDTSTDDQKDLSSIKRPANLDDRLRFQKVQIIDAASGAETRTLVSGREYSFHVHCSLKPGVNLNHTVVSIGIKSDRGSTLFTCRSEAIGKSFTVSGDSQFICNIKKWPLTAGNFDLALLAEEHGQMLDWLPNACALQGVSGDFYGTGYLPRVNEPVALIPFSWTLESVGARTT